MSFAAVIWKKMHAYHLPVLTAVFLLSVTFTPLRNFTMLLRFALVCGAVAIIGIVVTLVAAIALENKAAYLGKLSGGFFVLLVSSMLCVMRGGDYSDAEKIAACEGNLRKLHTALMHYASDYGGYFPPLNDQRAWDLLAEYGYLRRGEAFQCPGAVKGAHDVSYRFYGGKSLNSPPGEILAEDAEIHPDGTRSRLKVGGTITH